MAFSAWSSDVVRAALAKACAELIADEEVIDLDLYRRLADEAKVMFETEKLKIRAREHPMTADVVMNHPTLLDFTVNDFMTHYDVDRNCTIEGALTFDTKVHEKKQVTKKPKLLVADRLGIFYEYDRKYAGEPFGTTVSFNVHVSFGYGPKKSLVQCVFRVSGRYPVSYYARQVNQDTSNDEACQDTNLNDEECPESIQHENIVQEVESNDGGDGVEIDELSSNASSNHNDGESDVSEEEKDGDVDVEDGGSQGEMEMRENVDSDDEMEGVHVLGSDEKNWEYVESFDFNQETLEDTREWFLAQSSKDLTPQDALGYILSMPFTEDEYAVDDRIFDIVFNDEESDEEED